jgi:hypothetical protein
MIRAILLFLGFRRPPLPPIAKRSTAKELRRWSALLAEDRKQFPHYWD